MLRGMLYVVCPVLCASSVTCRTGCALYVVTPAGRKFVGTMGAQENKRGERPFIHKEVRRVDLPRGHTSHSIASEHRRARRYPHKRKQAAAGIQRLRGSRPRLFRASSTSRAARVRASSRCRTSPAPPPRCAHARVGMWRECMCVVAARTSHPTTNSGGKLRALTNFSSTTICVGRALPTRARTHTRARAHTCVALMSCERITMTSPTKTIDPPEAEPEAWSCDESPTRVMPITVSDAPM